MVASTRPFAILADVFRFLADLVSSLCQSSEAYGCFVYAGCKVLVLLNDFIDGFGMRG